MTSHTSFQKVKQASQELVFFDNEDIQVILLDVADAIEKNCDSILEANKKDCEKMDRNDPKYDRLLLNTDRVSSIAKDIRNVAHLPSPLQITLEEKNLDNNLLLQKVSVPLGVIGVIYEARPNVTCDVFALCFKSGNACILKGGSDAYHSNRIFVDIIHHVLQKHDVSIDIITLLDSSRESTMALLEAVEFVDVIIPRGGQKLIDFVRNHSKVPVIETGAGIVHTYFDVDGDVQKGKSIIHNAKTRRVSVCNALDCLLIHKDRLSDLYELVRPLESKSVILFADNDSYEILHGRYAFLEKAAEHHFGTEFLSFAMSIKTVESVEDALLHIARYSSRHSEAIISENTDTIEYFLRYVDAAVVYANTSTAFTDGAQFGLGAEIGISTQKLHARGPMALQELTSYKWIVRGNGHIRE